MCNQSGNQLSSIPVFAYNLCIARIEKPDRSALFITDPLCSNFNPSNIPPHHCRCGIIETGIITVYSVEQSDKVTQNLPIIQRSYVQN